MNAMENGKTGFTLIEVLIALSIAAATVMVVGSGSIHVLDSERIGREMAEDALLLRTIECCQSLPAVKTELLEKHGSGHRISRQKVETEEGSWSVWQFSRPGGKSARPPIHFSDFD